MENVSDKALAQILRNEGTGSSAVEEAADRLEAPSIHQKVTFGTPPYEPLTKLEQFTMAAMQGVLANATLAVAIKKVAGKMSLEEDVVVAIISLDYAQATLSNLAETDP